MAGFTIAGICCFWALARTTMRTARVGCAGLVVLAPAKHLVRDSMQAIVPVLSRLDNESTHCNKGGSVRSMHAYWGGSTLMHPP
jgi:hypothetical protein